MSTKYGYEINLDIDSTASRVVKLVGKKKKVLEFGCSYGFMSKVLIDKFQCEVTGIEIDEQAAKKAQEICKKVIIGDVEKIDWETQLNGDRFDVIVFADVLEHLVHPWSVLRKVRDYLVEDGYIIASIPNASYLSVILELLEGNFRYRPLGILDNTHLRFFARNSILEMFEESGYCIGDMYRTKIPLSMSEFQTYTSGIDVNLLDNLKKYNMEWNTYQFIVRAYKSSETGKLQMLREEIRKLHEELKFDKRFDEDIDIELQQKNYIARLEKDIAQVNEYAGKLEKDIAEVNEYAGKLEKDIAEINEYAGTGEGEKTNQILKTQEKNSIINTLYKEKVDWIIKKIWNRINKLSK